MKFFYFFLAVSVVTGLFLCPGPNAALAQREYLEPVTISPQALVEAYRRNFHEADAAYTGRLLIVTGRIKTIRPPDRNYDFHVDKLYAYITIDTGRNLPIAVYFWNWEAEKFIRNLKSGSTISVMGFCQGVPPQLSLVDSCVYPQGCGGPVQGFQGPYYKLPYTTK